MEAKNIAKLSYIPPFLYFVFYHGPSHTPWLKQHQHKSVPRESVDRVVHWPRPANSMFFRGEAKVTSAIYLFAFDLYELTQTGLSASAQGRVSMHNSILI